MSDSPVTTIIYIAIGIFLAFGVNLGMAYALSTDLPIVAVESNSMVPTFQKGDILILQGSSPEDLAVGDVIVFTPKGHSIPIVHRIIELNDDGTFQTKGDANNRQLPFEIRIEPDQIHGRKIFIIPYIGWVKLILTETIIPNAGVVIALVAVIVGAYAIREQTKSTKSSKA